MTHSILVKTLTLYPHEYFSTELYNKGDCLNLFTDGGSCFGFMIERVIKVKNGYKYKLI